MGIFISYKPLVAFCILVVFCQASSAIGENRSQRKQTNPNKNVVVTEEQTQPIDSNQTVEKQLEADKTGSRADDSSKIPGYILITAIVTSVATSIYMIFSGLQWLATKRIYEASNRPYVGVEYACIKNRRPDGVNVEVLIKNSGSILATNIRYRFEIILGGVTVCDFESEEFVTLPPQASIILAEKIIDHTIDSYRLNNEPLKVFLEMEYEGISRRKYYYREKNEYDSKTYNLKRTFGEAN